MQNYTWEQFKSLEAHKNLPINEVHRKYFIYTTDMKIRQGYSTGRNINNESLYIDDYVDPDYLD